MSSTLHVQRVIIFLYVGSRRLLHNLTDMHRKASAGLGLRVAIVRETPSDYVMSYSLSLSFVYSLFPSPPFLVSTGS
jgi:hypothetical protein